MSFFCIKNGFVESFCYQEKEKERQSTTLTKPPPRIKTGEAKPLIRRAKEEVMIQL